MPDYIFLSFYLLSRISPVSWLGVSRSQWSTVDHVSWISKDVQIVKLPLLRVCWTAIQVRYGVTRCFSAVPFAVSCNLVVCIFCSVGFWSSCLLWWGCWFPQLNSIVNRDHTCLDTFKNFSLLRNHFVLYFRKIDTRVTPPSGRVCDALQHQW